ncbi:unnamed protein product [Taenia asiatica]|uniref:Uncharacterized protein n=1 Tax=Taenia asiatica TaxID=60517 RepID=A0A0R3VX95_TAEAS|nr:unnamed protein product [Taenia asiatica]
MTYLSAGVNNTAPAIVTTIIHSPSIPPSLNSLPQPPLLQAPVCFPPTLLVFTSHPFASSHSHSSALSAIAQMTALASAPSIPSTAALLRVTMTWNTRWNLISLISDVTGEFPFHPSTLSHLLFCMNIALNCFVVLVDGPGSCCSCYSVTTRFSMKLNNRNMVHGAALTCKSPPSTAAASAATATHDQHQQWSRWTHLLAHSGRIPRPIATVANTISKPPVVSSMLSNKPSFGVSKPTPAGKPESELNDSTVPPFVAAPTSVATAAASYSTDTSSADSMMTATTTAPPSSS